MATLGTFKRGDINPETGLVFWSRGQKPHHANRWLTPEKFAARKEQANDIQLRAREINPDYQAEWARRHRAENRDELRPKWREEYHANKETILARRSKRRLENLPKMLEIERRNRANTPKEVISAKYKQWASRNLERLGVRNNLRSAKKRNLLHPMHDEQVELVLREQAKRLSCRLGIKFHIDHIIPVSKGGPHYHLNLIVMPATWNLRKSDGPLDVVPPCWHPISLNH